MSVVNPHKGRVGLPRLVHALGHSMAGLKVAFRDESAFRQEVLASLVLAPLACWLAGDWKELALLLGSLLLVLIVELLNSGLEAAIDRISYEHHELSKRAKDLGSAAVLVALVLCGLVWGLALWARLS